MKTVVIGERNCIFDEVLADWYKCPHCKKMEIRKAYYFCPICGSRIEWSI